MTSNFLFLLGSARKDGNTDLLARRAASALPEDTRQRWVHLEDTVLPRFEDHRHTASEIPQPTGVEKELLDATLEATDVVLATPLYWYNVSGSTKVLLDYWAGWLKVPGLDFRDQMNGKTLWFVVALGDTDPSVTDSVVTTLQMTAEYLGMTWGGILTGYGSAPGQILDDAQAMEAADAYFGSRVDAPREASALQ